MTPQPLDLAPIAERLERLRLAARRHPPRPQLHRCECADLGVVFDWQKGTAYPCFRCRREQWEHFKRGGYLPSWEGGMPLSLWRESRRERRAG